MKNVNLQDTAKTKTAEDIRQRYNLDVIKSITSKQTNSGCAVGIGKKAAVSKGLDVAGKIICSDGFYNSSGSKMIGTNYGVCDTATATAAKVVTIGGFELITGALATIKFTYAVPANATLNIDSTGAKSIYSFGTAITAGVIPAGAEALLAYNGTQFDLLSVNTSIFESGSNSNGSYIKFNNGILICYGMITGTLTANNAMGSIYFSDPVSLAFPYQFYTTPTAITAGQFLTNGIVLGVMHQNVIATGIQTIRIAGANYGSSGQGIFEAIGRWKA